MTIKDCNIFYNGRFVPGSFDVDQGSFSNVKVEDGPEKKDRPYIIPGLVDIHTHGCMGYDFSDGKPEAMEPMARFYASHGVTSWCPTSMTLPYDVLSRAFGIAREYVDGKMQSVAAKVAGINMEGPYFSLKKKGAQNAAYLKLPDIEGFKKMYEDCKGLVSLVDLAPELEGAKEFAAEISKLCTVSVAHTDATYDEADKVFKAGADHLTHLYNAMPPIHHRDPGVIGAASENTSVFAELICDGHHIHPSAIRMAFLLFKDRICLISDSLRCAGMPDGEYELGGQPVFLRGGVARLEDGTIAGSSADLYTCMKNAISYGIPREDAIQAATMNPARSIRKEDMIGSIENGKKADFIVCDDKIDLKEVYIEGRKFE